MFYFAQMSSTFLCAFKYLIYSVTFEFINKYLIKSHNVSSKDLKNQIKYPVNITR